MRFWDFSRYALLSCAAFVLLAGCGGSQLPIGASGAMPQSRVVAGYSDQSRSWMLPETKNTDLLYASSGRTIVSVFTYPAMKFVETLSGFEGASGECVDRKGDIFITNSGTSSILEFAHGGTSPINTLFDPSYEPVDCSIDPTTGDLAVTNFDSGVAIYQSAKGSPTLYSIDGLKGQFCGYDDKGNLFVDGYLSRDFALYELQQGSSQFSNVSLDFEKSSFFEPGPIQWDGQYLAMGYGQENRSVIYRLSVSGSSATIVGSTTLKAPKLIIGIGWWIQGSTILAPNRHHLGKGFSNIGFWDYPKGGKYEKMFHYKGAEADFIQNLAVSRASR